MSLDVIVIGAGAAGLAASAELRRAGLHILCLEARDRVGGRILTVHDARSPIPIELGAEFIHGCPPEIRDIVQSTALHAAEIRHGDEDDPVIEAVKSSASPERDESFLSFLNRQRHRLRAPCRPADRGILVSG